jgi:hypothetical protein
MMNIDTDLTSAAASPSSLRSIKRCRQGVRGAFTHAGIPESAVCEIGGALLDGLRKA